jgi:PEGA domain-containing protein
MKTTINLAIASGTLFLSTVLTGCATLVNGTHQMIPVASSPAGARVSIDSVPAGVTPMVARVLRRQNHEVSITYDTFPPARFTLEHGMSGWVIPDFFVYIVPALADFSNGSAYTFPTDSLWVRFPDPFASHVGDAARRVPVSDGVRTRAIVSSTLIGFGSGHAMIAAHAAARRFFVTEMVSGSLAFVGLGMGMAGANAGAVPFFGGGAVLLGARAWEVADIIRRR